MQCVDRGRKKEPGTRLSEKPDDLTPPYPTKLVSNQPSAYGSRECDDQIFEDRVHAYPISIVKSAAKSAEIRSWGKVCFAAYAASIPRCPIRASALRSCPFARSRSALALSRSQPFNKMTAIL